MDTRPISNAQVASKTQDGGRNAQIAFARLPQSRGFVERRGLQRRRGCDF
jgi:hypothetical protein